MATRRWKPQPRKMPNGKKVWVARWEDKTGKRRIGWKPDIPGTYKTMREAQAAIDACLERDAKGPTRVDTVGAYFADWTKTHPRSKNTNQTNESRIRAVLDVPVDGVPFRDWTFEALRIRQAKVLADHMLRVDGRAHTGVNNVLNALSAMTRDAMEDEVATTNPFRDMRKIAANDPRIQKRQRPVRVFTWQDMHAFARACADAPDTSTRRLPSWATSEIAAWKAIYAEAMVRTLTDCGLRVGELFPLCLSDLSFTDGTLEVRWSVSAYEVLPGTKTDHFELGAGRTVPVPPDVLRMLDNMPKRIDAKVWRGEERGTLLFPSPRGRLWRYQAFHGKVWTPGQRASGLDMRPHETRHSYVSLLRAEGIDPADLADVAGHTERTATKTYTHGLGRSFDAIRRAVG